MDKNIYDPANSCDLNNIWNDTDANNVDFTANAKKVHVVKPLENKSAKKDYDIVGKVIAFCLIAFLAYASMHG